MAKDDIYTFVDLFCGAGGFTEGLLLSGGDEERFRLLLGSDVHANARETYQHRFGEQLGIANRFLQADISTPTFSAKLNAELNQVRDCSGVDVVVGGPPCQGFSVFGARNQDDPRNDLFRSYLKVISTLSPKYFVMENVPGLQKMYGGDTVQKIHGLVSRMKKPSYRLVGPILVNAADYGVPQLRERIFFIGARADMPPISDLSADHVRRNTVQDALSDLAFLRAWERCAEYEERYPATTAYQTRSRSGRLFEKYGRSRNDNVLNNHEAARHTPDIIARFAMIPPGSGAEAIPKSLWEMHLRTNKKWCVRLTPDKPSYTITTLPDDLVHYSQHRILTVRECARLQSFDDTFVFLGPRSSGGGGRGNKKRNAELPQYSQVGNAVPPLLAEGIGDVLLKALDSAGGFKRRKPPVKHDLLLQVH